jgi:hypothetical protein
MSKTMRDWLVYGLPGGLVAVGFPTAMRLFGPLPAALCLVATALVAVAIVAMVATKRSRAQEREARIQSALAWIVRFRGRHDLPEGMVVTDPRAESIQIWARGDAMLIEQDDPAYDRWLAAAQAEDIVGGHTGLARGFILQVAGMKSRVEIYGADVPGTAEEWR